MLFAVCVSFWNEHLGKYRRLLMIYYRNVHYISYYIHMYYLLKNCYVFQ